MARLTRRSALMLPLLAAPPLRAATWQRIPPFPDWVGRTALLRGDSGAARLLLNRDGTGLMAVRLFFFCRVLPILAWEMGAEGTTVRYRRVSALDANRVIPGEAHILREEAQLLWIEAARHTAELEGFAGAEIAGRCG